MERFLAHIVQRSLAASPALAPRLAGRYEEARAAAGVTESGEPAIALVQAALAPAARRGEETPANNAGKPEPAREPVRSTAPHAQARPAQHDTPAPVEQEILQVDAAPGTRKSEAAAPPIPVPVLVASRAGTLTVHPAQQLIADETAPAQPVRTVNGGAQAGALTAHPTPRTDAGNARDDAPAPAGSDPAGSDPDCPDARFSTMLFTETSTATPRAVAPSVPVAREPRIALQAGALTEAPPRGTAFAAAQPRAAPVQATQAAPPVLVTIGRVELRAAAPAAAPAPARAAPVRPALSLGDYLLRRDQEAGR